MLDLLGTHHLLSRKPESAYIATEYNFTNAYFDQPQHFKRFNGLAKYTGQLSDRTALTLFGSYFTSNWDASGQVPDRAVSEGLISRFGSLDPSEGGNTNRTNAYAVLTTALPHGAVPGRKTRCPRATLASSRMWLAPARAVAACGGACTSGLEKAGVAGSWKPVRRSRRGRLTS
jgi:hypothetical protein